MYIGFSIFSSGVFVHLVVYSFSYFGNLFAFTCCRIEAVADSFIGKGEILPMLSKHLAKKMYRCVEV